MTSTRKGLLAAALLTAGLVTTAGPAHAAEICEQYGTSRIQGGRYIVQNNRWGADTPQCIEVTDTGFRVTRAEHANATNGAPASYPSVYIGCHYDNCTEGSNLPVKVSDIRSATGRIDYSYTSGGTYNAAYDIWLDPSPRTGGQNATEIMIWFNRQGSIQPIGSPVGRTTIGGREWEVWRGGDAFDVVSYLAPAPIESWSFDISEFIDDVRDRGAVGDDWYLTSIQAGFEPWVGGTGLAVDRFEASINGAAAPAPTPSTTTTVAPRPPAPTPSTTVAPTPPRPTPTTVATAPTQPDREWFTSWIRRVMQRFLTRTG